MICFAVGSAARAFPAPATDINSSAGSSAKKMILLNRNFFLMPVSPNPLLSLGPQGLRRLNPGGTSSRPVD